jgi:hypothetical protein
VDITNVANGESRVHQFFAPPGGAFQIAVSVGTTSSINNFALFQMYASPTELSRVPKQMNPINNIARLDDTTTGSSRAPIYVVFGWSLMSLADPVNFQLDFICTPL